MLDNYILDTKHQVVKVDVLSWARWFEKSDRHVAKSTIKTPNRLLWFLGLRNDYWISTVFLGIDHSFSEDGPPVVFETMVFPRFPGWKRWLHQRPILSQKPAWWKRPLFRKITALSRTEPFYSPIFRFSEWSEEDMDRYSTWDEAVKGHIDMREKWMKIAGTTHHETEITP